ncbi:RNA 2',3'-cyclic phosphodiesterase [Tropicimonas isoalkanivorans]|uniref:RNA 2',3'-cyclic phosphodiesterase n=1 Tax=Tropicimonas isoalkanivorans TaxID=441112 RepID=A0A1I1M1A7_9RHOB|nr:RNA 2',3'-cyclic phosphodiesterase [Tropicimonas isoalkanivorans]SFC78542.1 2'-5' RNA ligase [Tropicimonas isoalkanivorans]
MRCFIAIPLPEPLRDRLADIQDGLPCGRATPPENLHLTLAFLGEIETDQAVAVHEALASLHAAQFEVQVAGLDLFGGKAPKILVAGVHRSEPLLALHASVRRKLTPALTLPRERYRPHVTLARFNRPPGRDEIARLGMFLQANALFEAPPFDVEGFSLYQSELGHGPARHTELAFYPLA